MTKGKSSTLMQQEKMKHVWTEYMQKYKKKESMHRSAAEYSFSGLFHTWKRLQWCISCKSKATSFNWNIFTLIFTQAHHHTFSKKNSGLLHKFMDRYLPTAGKKAKVLEGPMTFEHGTRTHLHGCDSERVRLRIMSQNANDNKAHVEKYVVATHSLHGHRPKHLGTPRNVSDGSLLMAGVRTWCLSPNQR